MDPEATPSLRNPFFPVVIYILSFQLSFCYASSLQQNWKTFSLELEGAANYTSLFSLFLFLYKISRVLSWKPFRSDRFVLLAWHPRLFVLSFFYHHSLSCSSCGLFMETSFTLLLSSLGYFSMWLFNSSSVKIFFLCVLNTGFCFFVDFGFTTSILTPPPPHPRTVLLKGRFWS